MIGPSQTLLDSIRVDGDVSVKEGCASGDCGACTVVLASPNSDGTGIHWAAVNSCIRLAGSALASKIYTAQDLPGLNAGRLHPVQQALVDCHASQCGFCTPGFVMSLFALYMTTVARGETVTQTQAVDALSGNLCRCTGYGPILQAALTMHRYPVVLVDEKALVQELLVLAEDEENALQGLKGYHRPKTLKDLLALRSRNPNALIAAGTTDAGLWITKQLQSFEQVIDITATPELLDLSCDDHTMQIGAGRTITQVFEVLTEEWPEIKTFLGRFAGLPIRNSATLGGNIANGSPIGDCMPLLLALNAELILSRLNEKTIVRRAVMLSDFYLAYKKTRLQPDEILQAIRIPRRGANEHLRAYKVSKRFEDDISAVCLVVWLCEKDAAIHSIRMGAGGVAAVPVRAYKAEAALLGSLMGPASFDRAAKVIQDEFQPISDMRASGEYRRQVLGNLLVRLGRALASGEEESLDGWHSPELFIGQEPDQQQQPFNKDH